MSEEAQDTIVAQDGATSTENTDKLPETNGNVPEKTEETTAKSSEQEENWKTLRENYKREKQAKEALEKFLVENMDKFQSAAPAQAPAQETPWELPDDYLQGQDLRQWEEKRLNKLVEDRVAATLEKKESERLKKELPARVAKEMPDYNTVCSEENLAWFESNHPEIAEGIAEIKDPYKLRAVTYNYMKKVLPNKEAAIDKGRAQANQEKPQATSAVGQQPVSQNAGPAYISRERRSQLYQDMLRAARGG